MDAEVLKLLVCPVTHSTLRPEGDELVATVGGLRYPIRDGIPVLLPEQAKLPADCPSLDALRARLASPEHPRK
jgi:uncharacterized protein YbaR (Trm112 family)